MKEFTLEELSSFNGRSGRATYIAHEGKIYDLSESALWIEGTHMDGHYAGGDLTDELSSAPHGTEMLERFPQVGILKT